MIKNTERIILKENINKENSLNISLSSNNSYYEQLNDDTKRDIIFLIKSGYNKKAIIKLYIFINPSNVNEAIHYLSKENGINQHIFINNKNNSNICEICGEKKNEHINEINNSINNSSYSSVIFPTNRIQIRSIECESLEKYKCKICDKELCESESLRNKCEKCDSYYCDECLYMHIKELIKNGKYELYCPECKIIYDKMKIEQILSYNIESKNEIENLKKLLKNNNLKNYILSNPNLMFCPIADCEGFAEKNKDSNYNICSMGHKFCPKCGELWHKNGKCSDEENIDNLFNEYFKKFKLKKCPFCQIITLRKGGCNHITCTYCKKNWCWLCEEIFETTDEHYGNINSTCYNRMMNNNNNDNIIICSNCDNPTNSYKFFRKCEHIICYDCLGNYLLENDILRLSRTTELKCFVEGCNQISIFRTTNFIDSIKK